MAVKKRLKKVTSIDQIRVCIPACPGCGHQHEVRLSRPETRKGCSYQTGTFIVLVTSRNALMGGGLELSVKFQKGYEEPVDITELITVEVDND
jgi:hypothetical protein